MSKDVCPVCHEKVLFNEAFYLGPIGENGTDKSGHSACIGFLKSLNPEAARILNLRRKDITRADWDILIGVIASLWSDNINSA